MFSLLTSQHLPGGTLVLADAERSAEKIYEDFKLKANIDSAFYVEHGFEDFKCFLE